MNKRIRELAVQAGMRECSLGYGMPENVLWGEREIEKFGELMAKECEHLLQQEWYRLNNLPVVEGESPRDIGMRVGAKSELIKMMAVLNKHFGVEE